MTLFVLVSLFFFTQHAAAQKSGALTDKGVVGVGIGGQGSGSTFLDTVGNSILGPSSPVASNPGQSAADVPCADVAGPIPTRVDITCGIAKILNYIADGIFGNTLQLANEAVAGAIKVNFGLSDASNDSFVKAGWPIMRDVANLFFVFILLWIALATIFDFEEFSAKRLLPRFVLSALLINFSLAIGVLVISLANTVGAFFYAQVGDISSLVRIAAPAMQIVKDQTNPDVNIELKAQQDKKAQLDDLYKKTEITFQYKGVGALFGGSSLSTSKISGADCLTMYNQALKGEAATDVDIRTAKAEACAKAAGKLWKAADFIYLNTKNDGIAMILAKQFVLKLILYVPMIFILFSIAALMIVRYVSLLFLLTLGPLAFLALILPGTQSHWGDWWKKLINWSVFLPVFSILFYISIKTLDALNAQQGGASMLSYMLTLAFMLATLLVAQQLGVHGANFAANLGKKWANGARDWAKGRATYARQRAAGTAASVGLQAGLGRIPLVRTALGRAAATGEQARKDEEKRRLGFAKNLTAKDRANWLANKSGSEAAAFLNSLDEKGRKETLGVMSYGDQMRAMNKLRGVNSEHLVRDFTGDPRVYLRAVNEKFRNLEGGEADSDFQKEVNQIIASRFKDAAAQNLSSDFITSNVGKQWLQQEGTDEQIKAIGGSIRGIRALNIALGPNFNANDYKGKGTSDFLNSTAARAIFRRGNRIYENLRKGEGQTIPKGYLTTEELNKRVLEEGNRAEANFRKEMDALREEMGALNEIKIEEDEIKAMIPSQISRLKLTPQYQGRSDAELEDIARLVIKNDRAVELAAGVKKRTDKEKEKIDKKAKEVRTKAEKRAREDLLSAGKMKEKGVNITPEALEKFVKNQQEGGGEEKPEEKKETKK